jgi:hypothetical protein
MRMSKTMAITQIERQIEELPVVEQLKMLERMVRHLRQLLLSQSVVSASQTQRKRLTEQLNHVYKVEASRLDKQFAHAQIAVLALDDWQ